MIFLIIRRKERNYYMGSDEFPQKGYLSLGSSSMSRRRNFLLTYPVQYVLGQQRLICLFVGFGIASILFSVLPSSDHYYHPGSVVSHHHDSSLSAEPTHVFRRVSYELHHSGVKHAINAGGKLPLELKSKRLRVLVTGGAGFVGSHLVDRLMSRGDSVIVVDNFFTGRKENLLHHFKNYRFELIRHDVVEPILVEVDQIYHLACPASPVHYKYNPVKTIKTNVMGTLNMLGLAKRVGARFLLTSTSEVYGDPLQHPQEESYWGNVNPIGQSHFFNSFHPKFTYFLFFSFF